MVTLGLVPKTIHKYPQASIAYSSNSVLLGGGGGDKHCQVHLIEYFMKNHPHQYSTISYWIIA